MHESVFFRLQQHFAPQREPARFQDGRTSASKLRQRPQSDRSGARRTCQSLALRQPSWAVVQAETGSA